jgi:hypothetical protein
MNRCHIEPTKFTNMRTGNETYGYRCWDDFGQSYENCLERIPDDDLKFLELVLNESINEVLWAIIDFCEENQHSLEIGNMNYEWEEIAPIIKRVRG